VGLVLPALMPLLPALMPTPPLWLSRSRRS
jgi:hypothetical protein